MWDHWTHGFIWASYVSPSEALWPAFMRESCHTCTAGSLLYHAPSFLSYYWALIQRRCWRLCIYLKLCLVHLIEWEPCPAVQYSSHNRTPAVRIAPLAVYLTERVMADTQIHYCFINNTVFVSWNVILKDNIYMKMCFNFWTLIFDSVKEPSYNSDSFRNRHWWSGMFWFTKRTIL